MDEEIIQGAENIKNVIINRLNYEKQRLLRNIIGVEHEYLYLAFNEMNHIFGREYISRTNGDVVYPNMEILKIINGFKGIMDTILEARHTIIKPPKSGEEYRKIRKKMVSYFNISILQNKLKIQENWPAEKAFIKNGAITSDGDPKLYEGLKKWIYIAGTEPEWGNWYPDTLKIVPDLNPMINQAFHEAYNLDFKDLTQISFFLEGRAKSHQQEVHPASAIYGKFPLFQIEKKWLFENFSEIMDKQRAERWIRKLKYKPWNNILLKPLLPLKRSKKDKFFALAHWVFSPYNQFWSAWFDDLMSRTPQTTVHGMITNWYGSRFEEFVDKKVGEDVFGENKVENLGGEWKIKEHEFPEIGSWLPRIPPKGKKHEFGIDRFIIKDKLVFVVSCKARDYMLNRKLRARDFFFPISEMMTRIYKNIDHMGEINMETECISKNPAIVQCISLKGNYLIPIVLTPFNEPITIDELRSYVSQTIRPAPKVQIITIFKFIDLLKKTDEEILSLDIEKYRLD